MSTFPAIRTTTQQSTQLFVDPACLILATDIQVAGIPVPRSIIRPVQGLWPLFTSSATTLYYRDGSGLVASLSPLQLDLVTPYTVEAGGSDPASLVALFEILGAMGFPITYTGAPVPTISSLTPASGLATQSITIAGTGFINATAVKFGTASVAFTIVDDLTITTIAPAHASGVVSVTVVSPAGTSSGSNFAYGPAVITPPLSPATGTTDGGDAVVITGTGFTGATGVTFATIAGTSFSVVNDTTIHVTTPAVIAGPAAVVVLSPLGNSTPGSFTFA
jgi:hypothetical protein